MLEILFALLFVGGVTGLISGLLGIGGGILTVPALFYSLRYLGFPEEALMRVAISTALATTVLTSSGSSLFQHRRKAISYDILKKIAPGLVLGCLAGAIIVHLLNEAVLQQIFGVAAVFVGLYLFLPLPAPKQRPFPPALLLIFGFFVGCISSLLGVGGGVFLVPFFLGFALPMRASVALSSVGTLITAVMGTSLYLFMDWGQFHEPWVFSSIYIPGFLCLGVTSLLASRFGVQLSHSIDVSLLKKGFAAFVSLMGILMLLK